MMMGDRLGRGGTYQSLAAAGDLLLDPGFRRRHAAGICRAPLQSLPFHCSIMVNDGPPYMGVYSPTAHACVAEVAAISSRL